MKPRQYFISFIHFIYQSENLYAIKQWFSKISIWNHRYRTHSSFFKHLCSDYIEIHQKIDFVYALCIVFFYCSLKGIVRISKEWCWHIIPWGRFPIINLIGIRFLFKIETKITLLIRYSLEIFRIWQQNIWFWFLCSIYHRKSTYLWYFLSREIQYPTAI